MLMKKSLVKLLTVMLNAASDDIETPPLPDFMGGQPSFSMVNIPLIIFWNISFLIYYSLYIIIQLIIEIMFLGFIMVRNTVVLIFKTIFGDC